MGNRSFFMMALLALPVLAPAGDRRVEIGTGMASYYGSELSGNRTASGERFDPNAMTAAHRTLSFGSLVAVTNLANGQEVVVRINDRGPFKPGRVIDLSYAAAGVLDMHKHGLAKVKVEVVEK